jgi:hypothetical protein
MSMVVNMQKGFNTSRMYFLNFNIGKKAAQLIKKASQFKRDAIASKSPHTSFDQELGSFILMVEGFQKHVENLKIEEAQSMLDHTKKVAKQFYQIKEDLENLEGIDKAELGTKLNYAIKVIHRLISMLHIKCTRDLPREKTPDYIKEGLAQYSREAIAQTLGRE